MLGQNLLLKMQLSQEWRVCVLGLFLAAQCCLALPVNKAQVKDKLSPIDMEQYKRYLEEMASNDPGKGERERERE